jgi:hypothetical protein
VGNALREGYNPRAILRILFATKGPVLAFGNITLTITLNSLHDLPLGNRWQERPTPLGDEQCPYCSYSAFGVID